MKKLMLVAIMILLAAAWNAYASEDLTLEEGSANFVDPRYGIAMIGVAQRTDSKDLYTAQELIEVQKRIAAATDTPAGSVGGATSPNAAEGEGLRMTMANAGAYTAIPAIGFMNYDGYVWELRRAGAITPDEHDQLDAQLDQLSSQQTQITGQMDFLLQSDHIAVLSYTDPSPVHNYWWSQYWAPNWNKYSGYLALPGDPSCNWWYNNYIGNPPGSITSSTVTLYKTYESQYTNLQSQSNQLESELDKPVMMSSSEYMAMQNAQLAAHQREEEQHQVQFQQDTKAQNDITCLRY